jgi:hypothetical protein
VEVEVEVAQPEEQLEEQLEEAVVLLILRHRIRGHMIQCQICPSQDRPMQPKEMAQPEALEVGGWLLPS